MTPRTPALVLVLLCVPLASCDVVQGALAECRTRIEPIMLAREAGMSALARNTFDACLSYNGYNNQTCRWQVLNENKVMQDCMKSLGYDPYKAIEHCKNDSNWYEDEACFKLNWSQKALSIFGL